MFFDDLEGMSDGCNCKTGKGERKILKYVPKQGKYTCA